MNDDYDFSGLNDIMLVAMFKEVKESTPDDKKFINAIQEELKERLEKAIAHELEIPIPPPPIPPPPRRATVCCGYHWTVSPLDDTVEPVEVLVTDDPLNNDWELVNDPDGRFHPTRDKVWLCPDCIEKLKNDKKEKAK